MKFTTIGPDGESKMTTEHVNAIPWDDLDDMAAAGFKFRLDGKLITKNELRKSFNVSSKPQPSLNTEAKPTKYLVKCVESGKIYNTQSEAARDLGIDPAQVSDSLKTGRPRSGYRFEKVPA